MPRAKKTKKEGKEKEVSKKDSKKDKKSKRKRSSSTSSSSGSSSSRDDAMHMESVNVAAAFGLTLELWLFFFPRLQIIKFWVFMAFCIGFLELEFKVSISSQTHPFNWIHPRKPKALSFGAKVGKIADLKVYLLASTLGKVHPCLTEQALMLCGGELFEMRRHALCSLKASEDSGHLRVRVQLAEKKQAAERKWRERLLQLLDKGE